MCSALTLLAGVVFKELAVRDNLVSDRFDVVSGLQLKIGPMSDFTVNFEEATSCNDTGDKDRWCHIQVHKNII